MSDTVRRLSWEELEDGDLVVVTDDPAAQYLVPVTSAPATGIREASSDHPWARAGIRDTEDGWSRSRIEAVRIASIQELSRRVAAARYRRTMMP